MQQQKEEETVDLGALTQVEKEKYLRTGLEYPAGTEEVAFNAEANGAPKEMVEMIRGLPADERFSGPQDVMAALEGLPRVRTPK